MKKVLPLLLPVLMLTSVGSAWAEDTIEEVGEITFQSIPWGSTYEDMKIPKGRSKLLPFFLCKGKLAEKFAAPIIALSGLVMPCGGNSFNSSDSKFVT